MAHKPVFALIASVLPGAALADYVGTLRTTQSTLTPPGVYSFASPPAPVAFATTDAFRIKLGYKPSRYFAVEGEVVDFGRADDPFSSPAHLASQFRGTGFGVDTIAMLPLWRFSFYGRMGAYRGDARGGYGWHPMPLAENQFTRGTRLRYGLGLRYDFTRSFGVRAELERHSPLREPLLTEIDSGEQVSVGLSWRF
jgi:OmpA-OmpF porin, OOP family